MGVCCPESVALWHKFQLKSVPLSKVLLYMWIFTESSKTCGLGFPKNDRSRFFETLLAIFLSFLAALQYAEYKGRQQLQASIRHYEQMSKELRRLLSMQSSLYGCHATGKMELRWLTSRSKLPEDCEQFSSRCVMVQGITILHAG